MKLIIAGSRHIDTRLAYQKLLLHQSHIENIFKLNKDFDHIEWVSGACKGPDQVPFLAGYKNVTVFAPKWVKHGRRAGPIRNEEMAKYADGLILIWDGNSSGSKNMLENMLNLHKPIYSIRVGG